MQRSTSLATGVLLTILMAGPALAQATGASKSLTKCQNAAQKETAKYAATVQKAIGSCLQNVAKRVVQPNQTTPDLSRAVGGCVNQFYRLGQSGGRSAAAKMQSKILAACDPAAARVAHSDDDLTGTGAPTVEHPLNTAAIDGLCGSFADGSGNLTDWIACLRGAAECQGRQNVAVAFPRAVEWLVEVEAAIGMPPPSDVKTSEALAALQAAAEAMDGFPVDLAADINCGPAADTLATCAGDLNACTTAFGTCSGELDDCTGELALLQDEIDQCDGDLAACTAALGTCPDDLADCEAEPKGQLVRTGQTFDFGPGSDGHLQAGLSRIFVDNGDGTVTDTRTGLMWEKKGQAAGVHHVDNQYTWGLATSPYTMNGTVVTEFLATLNSGGGFAGYTDWRIPNRMELSSILHLGAGGPATFSAFHSGCTAACDVTTCSCTASSNYWSSTSHASVPGAAWLFGFNIGSTATFGKDLPFRARAVRGGLPPAP